MYTLTPGTNTLAYYKENGITSVYTIMIIDNDKDGTLYGELPDGRWVKCHIDENNYPIIDDITDNGRDY